MPIQTPYPGDMSKIVEQGSQGILSFTEAVINWQNGQNQIFQNSGSYPKTCNNLGGVCQREGGGKRRGGKTAQSQ